MLNPRDVAASRGETVDPKDPRAIKDAQGRIIGRWTGSVVIQPGASTIQGQVLAKSEIQR